MTHPLWHLEHVYDSDQVRTGEQMSYYYNTVTLII